MVIQDLGLWIPLQQRFAGSRSVEITEAANWQQALTLARLEEPELVVCSSSGLEFPPDELVERFEAAEIHGVQILCVMEDQQLPGARVSGSGPLLCQRDGLLEVLEECLDRHSGRSLGPRVELLASFEDIRSGESSRTSGFANVLELGRSELLIEADQPLGVGDVFGLNFFIPRTAVTGFSKISMSCRVAESRNEEKLLYVIEIVDLDAVARQKLGRFVSYQERGQEA
jgi:hypothetical protein